MATVSIPTGAGPMGLFGVRASGEPRGAVIVVQEAFGVNRHIEDVAGRFAAAGYRAAAPHLFHRTGDPVVPYGDMAGVRPHMQALTVAGLLEDLDATLGYLADRGFSADRVGIVGFCMGGSVALLAAVRKRLAAAVTFYGGGVSTGRFGLPPLTELAPELQTPWLGLFGDLDRSIPVADVEGLRAAAAKAPVPTEIVRYPEAGHGFHCDARPSYQEESAKDGWARTLAWLADWMPPSGHR